MRTPEEFAENAGIHVDNCGDLSREDLAEVIRERDAEVRAAERGKAVSTTPILHDALAFATAAVNALNEIPEREDDVHVEAVIYHCGSRAPWVVRPNELGEYGLAYDPQGTA